MLRKEIKELLKKNCWKKHEPRFGFPIFKNITTNFSFSIQVQYTPLDLKKFRSLIYMSLKLGLQQGGFSKSLKNLFQLI